MEVIEYQEKYKQDFIRLNTAWVEKYFVMEETDREILSHTDDFIQKGGMIYFAIEDNKVLATCMVIPEEKHTWEILKLAADDRYIGHGAGSAVFKACMDYAIANKAKKITLISNHILKPALHIYEKFGFRQVKVDRTEYERCDVQCEYIVPNNKMKLFTMVTKKEEAKKRTFKGVSLDSLAVGEKSMVCKMNYVKGNFATLHQHPHEQSGYVISGRYRLTIDGREYELNAGDSYAIPGNVPHSFEVLEGGEVIDVFTPIREDYL